MSAWMRIDVSMWEYMEVLHNKSPPSISIRNIYFWKAEKICNIFFACGSTTFILRKIFQRKFKLFKIVYNKGYSHWKYQFDLIMLSYSFLPWFLFAKIFLYEILLLINLQIKKKLSLWYVYIFYPQKNQFSIS